MRGDEPCRTLTLRSQVEETELTKETDKEQLEKWKMNQGSMCRQSQESEVFGRGGQGKKYPLMLRSQTKIENVLWMAYSRSYIFMEVFIILLLILRASYILEVLILYLLCILQIFPQLLTCLLFLIFSAVLCYFVLFYI